MCSLEIFCILLLVSQSQCYNFNDFAINLVDGILAIENSIDQIKRILPPIQIPKIDVKNLCFYGECCTDEFIPAKIIGMVFNMELYKY